VRWTTLVALGAAGVYLARRVQDVAEREGTPLADLVSDLPRRLSQDLATVPDDVRMAAAEGRLAAERRIREIDDELRESGAGG
jgi:hypothetical protein